MVSASKSLWMTFSCKVYSLTRQYTRTESQSTFTLVTKGKLTFSHTHKHFKIEENLTICDGSIPEDPANSKLQWAKPDTRNMTQNPPPKKALVSVFIGLCHYSWQKFVTIFKWHAVHVGGRNWRLCEERCVQWLLCLLPARCFIRPSIVPRQTPSCSNFGPVISRLQTRCGTRPSLLLSFRRAPETQCYLHD
jgi:hypothetical protein